MRMCSHCTTVRVVVTRLYASTDEVRSLQASLSAVETERAGRFRFERHRRRFIVAPAACDSSSPRASRAARDIELAYGRNGKPRLVSGD